MRKLVNYTLLAVAVAGLLALSGCKRANRPEPRGLGAPVKASPTEQRSLYLAISPRDLLTGRMPGSGAESEITGGWGFTKEDACVIHNPKNIGQSVNRDFLKWVQALIDFRNVLEFTQTQPSGERLYVIDSAGYVQENNIQGGRRYLKVLYSVFTVSEAQFRELSYWVKDPKVTDEMFSQRVRETAREEEREFWFDITEPHNHNARVRGS